MEDIESNPAEATYSEEDVTSNAAVVMDVEEEEEGDEQENTPLGTHGDLFKRRNSKRIRSSIGGDSIASTVSIDDEADNHLSRSTFLTPRRKKSLKQQKEWNQKRESLTSALTNLVAIEAQLGTIIDLSSFQALKSEITNSAKFFAFLMDTNLAISTEKMGYFGVLPPELILGVFSYLDYTSLLRVGCCCKEFRDIADDEYLWKQICMKFAGEGEKHMEDQFRPEKRTWKWLVKTRRNIMPPDCEKKKMTGVGKLVETSSNQPTTYCGDWSDGEKHGYGLQTWDQGGLHFGRWNHDKREGFGIRYWPNGNKYQGNYVTHKRHGKGKFTFSNGSVFEGTFEDNKFKCGSYTWPNGRIYNGEWDNTYRHGVGTYKWPDGRMYHGQWNQDKRDGHGVYTWPNGDRFEGMFRTGVRNGKGLLYLITGEVYEQVWKEDKFDEDNKMTCSSSQLIRQGKRRRFSQSPAKNCTNKTS